MRFLFSICKPIHVFMFGGIALVACTSFPNTNSDPAKNNPTAYKIEMRECAQDYPETPDGVYLRQRIACMKLKGWK